jgi:hypothetical protein
MDWLSFILGKKNAKTAKKIRKITSGLAATQKPTPAIKPPKVQWQKSNNGNDTAELEGFRVTIFQQDEGWNYCISEVLDAEDLADGLEDSPEFGVGYDSKSEAKKSALENLTYLI